MLKYCLLCNFFQIADIQLQDKFNSERVPDIKCLIMEEPD